MGARRISMSWLPWKLRVRGPIAGARHAAPLSPPYGPDARDQGFPQEESGKVACVAPAAQQAASRTGAKENR
jgi:hypothetical protein